MMGWKVVKGETGEPSKSEWKDNVTFSKGRLVLATKMECISGRNYPDHLLLLWKIAR